MADAGGHQDEAWRWLLDRPGVHERDGRLHYARERAAIEIVMTPAEWGALTTTPTGPVLDLLWSHWDEMVEMLESGDADELFLVLQDGRFRRSVRRALPPVAGTAGWVEAQRMRRLHDEAIARDPNAEVGWYAVRPDGTKDRLRDAP